MSLCLPHRLHCKREQLDSILYRHTFQHVSLLPIPACYWNEPNICLSAPNCKPSMATTTSCLIKLPQSKHTVLTTALNIECKVLQLQQWQISRIPCSEVGETQTVVRNRWAVGTVELAATVVPKGWDIQNYQGAHSTDHCSPALSILCVSTHVQLNSLIFNSGIRPICDHPFAPLPNLWVFEPSLIWSHNSQTSCFLTISPTS